MNNNVITKQTRGKHLAMCFKHNSKHLDKSISVFIDVVLEALLQALRSASSTIVYETLSH